MSAPPATVRCAWCRKTVRTHRGRVGRHTRITAPDRSVTGKLIERQTLTCNGSGRRLTEQPKIVRRPR